MSYLDIKKASLEDILALMIQEKPDSYVIKELLNKMKDSRGIGEITLEELQGIRGIGKKKAFTLIAAVELAKRMLTVNQEKKVAIRCPLDAANLMEDMKFLDREHFRAIHLNTKKLVICVDTVSIGTLNSSLVHPRELFKTAIKRSTAAILLVHNHPSGDPSPSREDIDITDRIADAGKILGIEVLDHIIIGNSFLSLKEQGLM